MKLDVFFCQATHAFFSSSRATKRSLEDASGSWKQTLLQIDAKLYDAKKKTFSCRRLTWFLDLVFSLRILESICKCAGLKRCCTSTMASRKMPRFQKSSVSLGSPKCKEWIDTLKWLKKWLIAQSAALQFFKLCKPHVSCFPGLGTPPQTLQASRAETLSCYNWSHLALNWYSFTTK